MTSWSCGGSVPVEKSSPAFPRQGGQDGLAERFEGLLWKMPRGTSLYWAGVVDPSSLTSHQRAPL